MYRDERGAIITRAELEAEYTKLSAAGETESATFAEYLRNCCGKNGTLEFIGEEDMSC